MIFRLPRCWFATVIASAAVAVLTGCGDRGPQYVEVEGTLTQKGKPLEKIRVEFHPTGPGSRSTALTDASGRFVLKTDDGSRPGAVVGTHQIVLRDLSAFPDKLPPRSELNQDFAKGKKSRIGPQYTDSNRTPIKQEITAGQKNEIAIEVP